MEACEGHSAMLKPDGTVLCMDQYPMDTQTQNYRQKVESWCNIRQVALTFDHPYALTHDGKILTIPLAHKTKDGKEATELENIIDIAMNFDHIIALSQTGEIIYLKEA